MNIPLQRYWRLLSAHIVPQKAQFALLSTLLLAGIGLQIIAPQIVRQVIDAAGSGAPLDSLLIAAFGYLGVSMVQQAVSVGAIYLGESVAWTSTNALRSSLLRHCLSLDMAFHNSTTPGELIERIDGDVTQLSTFFSDIVVRVVGNLLLALGIVVALSIEDLRLGAAFGVFTAVLVYSLNRVREIAVPYQRAVREAEAKLFGYIEEQLGGTEDIRSSGAVGFVLRGLYRLQYATMQRSRSADMANQIVRLVTSGLMTLGSVVGLVIGYFLHQRGALTVGSVYLVVQYINLLAAPIRQLGWHVQALQGVGGSIERLTELQARSSRAVDGPGAPIPDGALAIAFDAVDFFYSEHEPVLTGVTFTLEPGTVLGLLGRTGSGKTTLARLVVRLYDPTSGGVRLGGLDLRSSRLVDLRRRVAYVAQDVQLFHGSVRDNLTFFDRTIADEQLRKAIGQLGLADWYDTLPAGLDSPVAAGGRSLSGGEAQLLALTRVFLRDPGLVILDEASSRVDPATERRIERAVDGLLVGRTAIVIAHRLQTVHRSDDILILDGGRVVEYGGREQLAGDATSQFAALLATGLAEVLV